MRSQPSDRTSYAELLDGSVISLRRLDSGDRDQVVKLYDALSEDECCLRFFTMHPAHRQACARSLTEQSNNQ